MEWSVNPAILTKLFLAILFGGLIGFEREMHGRSAGLRTHMLVCIGSVLTIVVGRYVASISSTDPGRVVAGVITGVGFLGAGVIIRMEQGVRGLTTAACLWLVASLGIVIAFDLYAIAAITTALAIAILFGLSRLERVLPEIRSRNIMLHFEGSPTETEGIDRLVSESDCRIVKKNVEYNRKDNFSKLTFSVRTRETLDPAVIVEKLSNVENVKHVSWQ